MPDTFTQLVDEVFRLNGALVVEGDRLAENAGLTAARWRVLGRVADGPDTVAGIARSRGLKRQSVQEIVVQLERDGLVTRALNAADLRAPIVRISPRGQHALAIVEPERARWARETPGELTKAELEGALSTLRKIREGLARQSTG